MPSSGAVNQYSGTMLKRCDNALANIPPNVPQPLTPTNGSTLTDGAVQFTWRDMGDPDNGPTSYRSYYAIVKNSSGQEVAVMPWSLAATWSTTLANGTYSWQVKAGDGSGESPWSSAWTFTVQGVPAAPSDLASVQATKDGIVFSWKDNANNEQGFNIYRWRGEDQTWPKIGTVGANSWRFMDTNVVCGVTYFYLVSAFNSAGESGRAGWIDIKTPDCPIAVQPINFRNTFATASSLGLAWNYTSSDVQGFNIYRWADVGFGWTFHRIAQVGSFDLDYVDGGLTCGTTYYYKISAYNSYGESALTNWIEPKTASCPLAPPTGLHISSSTQTQVSLAWDGAAPNQLDGFYLYRWNGSQSVWDRIGTFGEPAISTTDVSLTCGMTYFYELKAFKDNEESDSTGWIETHTQPCATSDPSVTTQPVSAPPTATVIPMPQQPTSTATPVVPPQVTPTVAVPTSDVPTATATVVVPTPITDNENPHTYQVFIPLTTR